MIKAGIIGGAGYTAGELIRILVFHPEVEIAFVHSESNSGKYLYEVHDGLFPESGELKFCSEFDLKGIDVLFLCGAHGRSAEFWQSNPCPDGLKVIDLAQDFRDESEGYVYGLPEWRRNAIKSACKIANPGCFATAIQLALLPLATEGKLASEIQVTAITGSTGAGVKPSATTHFSWRNNNVSSYKVFEHQHLIEIMRNLNMLAHEGMGSADRATLGIVRGGTACGGVSRSETSVDPIPSEPKINFVPIRGDFARGIFASVYLDCELSEEQAIQLYKDYYKDAAFTFVSPSAVDLKQVVNTNKCLLYLEKHGSKLVISSVIDNLLKGASGQAVQNMNLIFGLSEDCGLKLKASAF